MRGVVVLLLLLNLGFAAWQLTRHERPAVQRPPADRGVEPLRLLSDDAQSPITSKNKLPPPPPTMPKIPSASPDAPTAEVPTGAPLLAQPSRCYVVGPFAESQQVEQLAQRLQAIGVTSRSRVDNSRTTVTYRVELPPLPSKESAVQVARQLAADGIADYQVTLDDAQRNVISLGVFKEQQTAVRRQAQIAALGYAPRIEAHEVPLQTYWLDTKELDQAAEAGWAALLAESPALHREIQECN